MSGPPARIYVVVSDASTRSQIVDRLTRLGYAVCGVSDRGVLDVRQIVEAEPDLLLADIDLIAGIDAVEASASLRRNGDPAVVFLNATADDALLHRALAFNSFGSVAKPFAEPDLHSALQMALRRRSAERTLRETNDALEVNIRARACELAASKARLRHLLEGSPVTIYGAFDAAEFSFNFVAPNVSTLLGYAPEDFTENPGFFRNLLHPDDVSLALSDRAEKLCSTGVQIQRYRARHRNGDWRWLRDDFVSIRNADDTASEIVGTLFDVTARMTIDLARQESDARLREAQRIARLGNWVTDRATGLAQWSETLYEIFGRDPKSAAPTREQYLAEIVFPEDEARVRRLLDAGASSGQFSDNDHRFRRPDGTIGWVHMEARAVRDGEGRIVGIRGTVQDITEQKKNEIEIGELNETLERRVEERTAALAESENRFRALFEQAAVGVVETDTSTGKILRVNRKLAEILGYAPEEIIDLGYRKLTHPDDAAGEILFMQKLRSGEIPEFSRDKRFVRKDGRIVWANTITSPLWAPGEAPGRHISVVTDITQRHQTEVATKAISTELVALDGQEYLEAAARKIDAVLGADIVFICRIDRARPGQVETDVLIVNGAIVPNISCDLAGTPCAEVIAGQPNLVSKEAWRRYPNDALIRENAIESCAVVPLVENSDRIVGYLGIMRRRPIQNRDMVPTILNMFAVAVAAAIVRERSRREYRDLFEFAPDGLVLSDQEGRIVLVNQQVEAIFGWTRSDLIGQNLEILIPQNLRHAHVGLREGFMKSPKRRRMAVERGTLQAQRKDGSVIPVEIDLAPVETDDGIMIAAAVRDITLRKRLEDQLAQSTKMEAMGKLTGGMAHDFNNYLGVIMGSLDLLKETDTVSPEQTELIDMALNGAERSAELTRSLLAFSRQQPLDPRVTDINGRLKSIAGMLRRTLGEDIELRTTPAADLWTAKIDGAQLDSCIVNLANNARDAMPHGGSLLIETRNAHLDAEFARDHAGSAAGDYVLIEVSDTGEGMPPEIVSRVFDPFFTTKRPGHGTGLGLSMVYGFVKQSGGYINIYSEPGVGTTIRIYLPRADLDDGRTETTPAMTDGLTTRANETILIVEDNEDVRDTAVAQLSSLGYRVIQAANAETALVILEAGEPMVDLLFTDVVMPGPLDGFALAAVAAERRPGIKILMTSGFPGDALRGNSVPEALALLTKPYRRAELAQAIRSAFDGGD